MIKETVCLLGKKAKDKVTGFEGVITSVCFDLYGCVQVAIQPAATSDKLEQGHWFDVQRTDLQSESVMPVPDFDARGQKPATYDRGPAAKPNHSTLSVR